MKRKIYNLEFPCRCTEITIFGYKFYRVKDYEEKVKRLQHLVSRISEYEIKQNTGGHSFTAYVELPEQEKNAIFQWENENSTALQDVLLLLSLFTGREVFDVDEGFTEDSNISIIADPRLNHYGGILRTSIPYESGSYSEDALLSYDIGFEKQLNRIYQLVRTDEWQENFEKGYYLILAKQALKRQILEATFIQCWTIWEHLFAVHNRNLLSDEEIRRKSSIEKISFLFGKYSLVVEISNTTKDRIRSLSQIRNKLVHFGRFPERSLVHDDADLFIRLTEFIIAKTLDLYPSNLFNTIEKLEKFLSINR
ncbi:hypothetical protein [Desulfosporosinus hippei]|uniref:Apea-like HEPN domain-containing protein n=1 Tax=Desulfosporosinus hippei DSM 8344 TaxID=1121419 RepID=A0A1G8CF36_9FIRM|nr:hypothetical protein [Desulfosporosinus hippei]SDH43949.1 hypothetical protein SAMN05443529_11381 [Desulfosporosinus hippei DSM 8344]